MRHSSVIFIINSFGQILLLRRASNDAWQPNKYGLPGGSLNDKETYEQAIIREVKEETGLKIFSPKTVLTVVTNLFSVKYFLTKNFFGTIILGTEHTDFKWVTPNDIIQDECVPDLRQLALKYAT